MSNFLSNALAGTKKQTEQVLELRSTPAKTNSRLAGAEVPTFEHSVVHAAARAALNPINEVNAFTSEMAEEWLNTKAGGQLRNLLRDYIQHGHAKSLEP